MSKRVYLSLIDVKVRMRKIPTVHLKKSSQFLISSVVNADQVFRDAVYGMFSNNTTPLHGMFH